MRKVNNIADKIEKLYGRDFGKADMKEVIKWLEDKGYSSLAKIFKKTS